jgi:undecaprenyl diphosphate synthase
MKADNLHVAIIMDGNGRWATERGLPRIAGHRAGVQSVRSVVEAAPQMGISVLTLYAFSEDNWSRPRREVMALFGLLRRYLMLEAKAAAGQGVRIQAIGRRDRLPASLSAALGEAEELTGHGTRLHLRIALDYSSRGALIDAARRLASPLTRESLSQALGPDVDLLIRTSGEQRLSDFLLWECAYAEFHFTARKWPEFGTQELSAALNEFRHRDRRFGGLALKLA